MRKQTYRWSTHAVDKAASGVLRCSWSEASYFRKSEWKAQYSRLFSTYPNGARVKLCPACPVRLRGHNWSRPQSSSRWTSHLSGHQYESAEQWRNVFKEHTPSIK